MEIDSSDPVFSANTSNQNYFESPFRPSPSAVLEYSCQITSFKPNKHSWLHLVHSDNLTRCRRPRRLAVYELRNPCIQLRDFGLSGAIEEEILQVGRKSVHKAELELAERRAVVDAI